MAAASELTALDAVAQAELVRARQVTPRELVEAAVARMEAVNPALNCVVIPTPEYALAQCDQPIPDGPLAGVPVLMKDLGQRIAGIAQTDGCRALRGNVAGYDSGIVTRYRQAGMLFVGKASSPEFGNHSTSEPLLYGPCRNPWALDCIAGGSSGGSASAVAAGIVPAAGSSDGAGSIRIPASCCGLVGLKPTRGRISSAPDPGNPLFGLSVVHSVTRTVRDCAALLDVAHGPMPGDPSVAPAPAGPYLAEVSADPGRLRIGWTAEAPTGAPVDPVCVAAVERTAALLEGLGHELVPAGPEFDAGVLANEMVVLWAVGNAGSHDAITGFLGRELEPDELEPTTWELVELGKATRAVELAAAMARLQLESRQVARFYETHDLWLTPTLAQPPAPLGVLNQSYGGAREWWAVDLAFNPWNPIANFTGLPSISLPLDWHEGLPIGTMLTGRFGREDVLLRVAGQLEQAAPWRDRRPPEPVLG